MHGPEAAKAAANSQKKEASRRRFADMKLLSTESDSRPVKEVTYLKILLSTRCVAALQRMRLSPAGQLGIERAPHLNQEPYKAESPHGFLTALLFDARKGSTDSILLLTWPIAWLSELWISWMKNRLIGPLHTYSRKIDSLGAHWFKIRERP